ncbi:hypothetical protein ACFXHA_34035 [Nocardia sp. NPDC059240]|uniref:hypothetical protein n=1 Tax=Nocardia sp. NPDC059240 TaxID=3346786 RepID=UPI0036AA684D
MNGSRFREQVGYCAQVAGGLVVGGTTVVRFYPMLDARLRQVFGSANSHVVGGSGVEIAGYWAAWLISFGALVAVGVGVSRIGRMRLFGVTATTFFVVWGVPISLLVIAFDFGGAPSPS